MAFSDEKRTGSRRGGPRTAAGKAKAVANLKPKKKGERGPGRHKNSGKSVQEWLNTMMKWTRGEAKAVMKDPEAPFEQLLAVRALLDAASRSRSAAGTPIAGPDFDRVLDRTSGKPRQAIEHTGANGGPIQQETAVTLKTDLDRCASEFDTFAGQRVGSQPLPPDRN